MGTCYVYTADVSILNYGEKYEEYYRLVPKYRREKIDSYKRQEPRLLSLGAGALLHMALAERGIDDTKLTVQEGKNGKPAYKDIEWTYNLSHSGTKVMCALCDVPVGCDVEWGVDRGTAIEDRIKIAKRFFAPGEFEKLRDLFEEKKTASGFTVQVINEQLADLFYRYWTLKESVIKATGLGIFMDLSSFEVQVYPDGTLGWGEPVKPLVNNKLVSNLRTYEIEGYEGYKYSVCVDSEAEYELEVKNILF